MVDFINKIANFNLPLCPPPVETAFFGGIRHPSVYIWDGWVYAEERKISLYALATPRAFYLDFGLDALRDRDHLPHHWRRFISEDGGKTWQDCGAVLLPRTGTGLFDSRSVWTGSVLKHGGRYLAAYTGIRDTGCETQPKLQALGLAASEDGSGFSPLSEEALLCPLRDYDAIRDAGYYLGPKETLGNDDGEEGGAILAWRDPYLVAEDGAGDTGLHMFWSAKSSLRRLQEAVIGHALIKDPFGRPQAELLPPVFLPDSEQFTQAEVPQLLRSEESGRYVMAVSATNKTADLPPEAVRMTLHFYSAPHLDGAWTALNQYDLTAQRRYPGILFGLEKQADGSTAALWNAPYDGTAPEESRYTLPAEMEKIMIFEN
ncbi:MAG: hypothetical protein EA357_00195 [Micavibrio sp.]|nr:MAG: hypothetical protein EA357_00195 [Micavibrio sp.]